VIGRSLFVLFVLAAGICGTAAAELRVDPPVGDGMVVQRGVPVPIRGSAAPGSEVVVKTLGRAFAARADAEGRWSVTLPPTAAGTRFELTVEGGGDRLVVRDAVAGDVWVCSGQSNMEWKVADARDAEREIAAARDPMIRHFEVPRGWAARPVDALAGGSWEAASPERVGAFTAVGYFFARELRQRAAAPIGLVNSTWGGSRIEPWMSAAALGLGPADVDRILDGERDYEREVLSRLRAKIGALPDRDDGLVGSRAVWADPALDDSGWVTIPVPSQWEEQGYEAMDGIAWYRTSFELTADEARAGARVGLGMIDDSDTSWVNGHQVGGMTKAWNKPRVYEAPPAFLRAGRNVIAVRVEDLGGGGGIWGPPDLVFVESAGRKRPLAAAWRFRPSVVRADLEFHKNQLATLIYNRMVHPLLRYPIRGVLWYQGESNTAPADARAYRTLFQAMIRDWRSGWGQGDIPFLWVQLAGYLSGGVEPPESGWALLREAQSAALALPATAQVVVVDIGDARDIHPRNKQEVGRRLALAARKVAYGEDLVFSGPVYARHAVEGGRVVIEFAHGGQGLAARGASGGELHGFTVAGPDRRFVPASAAIRGERVVVWSDAVPNPVAVRYAWADAPEDANMVNAEGLPASPFRTDDW
jgi:sialate O-acetylesterase